LLKDKELIKKIFALNQRMMEENEEEEFNKVEDY